METIIAEPIRRDPKLSAEVGQAMQILSKEAGKYESIVRAQWSLEEKPSHNGGLIRLVVQNKEFSETVEEQFSSTEFADSAKVSDRLHRTWTRVLSQYSKALGRRIREMVDALDED